MQVVVAGGVGCVSVPGKHFRFVRFRRVPVTLCDADWLPTCPPTLFYLPSTPCRSFPRHSLPVPPYTLVTNAAILLPDESYYQLALQYTFVQALLSPP